MLSLLLGAFFAFPVSGEFSIGAPERVGGRPAVPSLLCFVIRAGGVLLGPVIRAAAADRKNSRYIAFIDCIVTCLYVVDIAVLLRSLVDSH